MNNWKPLLVLFVVVLVSRIIPHPSNFTPVGALGLWLGYQYRLNKTMLFAFILMLVSSDYLVNGILYSSWNISYYKNNGVAWLYLATLLYPVFGFLTVKSNKAIEAVKGGFLGSIAFFLITNCAFFYSETLYTHDFAGLIKGYVMGLPFYRNTLLADVFFSGVVFWVGNKLTTAQYKAA